MYLVPTFKPPDRSLLRDQSQFDRWGTLLLGLSDSSFKIRSTPQAPPPMNLKKAVAESKQSAEFTLFDGEIICTSSASNDGAPREAVPRSAPTTAQPSTRQTQAQNPPAQQKRQTSTAAARRMPDLQQLSSLLDAGIPPQPQQQNKKRTASDPVPASTDQSKKPKSSSQACSKTTTTTQVFPISDFVGIEKFCRNAGASLAGLQAVMEKARAAKTVACAVVWKCLSTNHATTTVKYCTQSSTCTHWNCTCDRHVRGHYLAADPLGVLLHIPGEDGFAYFVPLMSCTGRSASTHGGSSSQEVFSQDASAQLPLQCGTTLEQRRQAVADLFALPDVVKVVYSAQLALIPLLQLTTTAPGIDAHAFTLARTSSIADPRLGAYLLDSDIPEASLELESLFDQHPQVRKTTAAAQLSGAWGAYGGDSSVASAVDMAGAGRVARLLYRVKGELECLVALQYTLQAQLAQQGLVHIYRDVEMPVASLLAQMERTGVVVSTAHQDEVRGVLSARIHDIELQIFAAAGTAPFNVASPEQVAHFLFETIALPAPAQTSKKGKHHSTSEEDLHRIASLHPCVALILDYRALAKLLSTYVDGLRPFICKESEQLHRELHGDYSPSPLSLSNEETGNAFSVLMGQARTTALETRRSAALQHRVHANWQQTVVRTGRLSCTKPNLQNIPKSQDTAGMHINMRAAFQASAGCVLVSADYSQIEMRVLAHLCRDPVLLELFRGAEGYDIYRQLAKLIFSRPAAQVSEEERTRAKVVCLGVLYGMGAQATATKLGIDAAQAGRITQTFFNHFKQIRSWIQQIKSQAKQYGLVRTLLGRVRRLPDIHSEDTAKSSYAERQAVNSVIQGTASDIIKYAMVNVDRKLAREWPGDCPAPRLLMQIHDELIYEVSALPACVERFTALLRAAMEEDVRSALKLSIPLVVNISSGQAWGSMM